MFDVLLTMAPTNSRLVDSLQREVTPVNVDEELIIEVEVVTTDNDHTSSEDMPVPTAETVGEGVSITATTSTSVATSTAESTTSVATSTAESAISVATSTADSAISVATNTTESAISDALSILPTYQNEMDLLVREVRALKERMADLLKRVQERLLQEETDEAARAANQPLEIDNASPEAALQPSASNPAAKRKSITSKYSKKRRVMAPGGNMRMPRSLNVKPTTTTVGTVNLATAANDVDEDEDFDY
uniref:Uncharacterized protein n=1 Tax=Lygus hesperus TaxID=30085 RepID=A0A0K8S7G7_LYGHE